MAAVAEMGEVEDIHSKEDGAVMNGNLSDSEMKTEECSVNPKKLEASSPPQVEIDTKNEGDEIDDVEENKGSTIATDDNTLENGTSKNSTCKEISEESEPSNSENTASDKSGTKGETFSAVHEGDGSISDEHSDDENECAKPEDQSEENSEDENVTDNFDMNETNSKSMDDTEDDVISLEAKENGTDKDEADNTIEVNDSGAEESEVMIIDKEQLSPKENGTGNSAESEVIELITPEKNFPSSIESLTPRRSSRNLNRQKSYVESEKTSQDSEESDIEEILPEDPLANIGDAIQIERIPSKRKSTANAAETPAIVVKDTKRLVEIAAKSSPPTTGKKEPTLVIIDTNSILCGRGPVPINKSLSLNASEQSPGYPTVLPMALPAQGMYPPNMRATITPIPLANQNQSIMKPTNTQPGLQTTPVLPTLTDDMFVVEAPSFIVPYVYEKPPIKNLKTFVGEYKEEVDKTAKKTVKTKDEKEDKDEESKADDKPDEDPEQEKKEDEKMYSYFGSPLGKFFIEIGLGLVQEFVQTDLLKQQKRKRDREHGKNPETLRTIQSLAKNLEFTKENNEPYKLPMKRCEFCPFKTESALAMSYHLETPHVKNYVYKCNFCVYETRSPHDILFHMEAEHMVRGRLERALSFHQCPNCPFEENQKGKLSRHLMACGRKFKPDRNLEPPLDWEPPAKIPRVPKMRQSLNNPTYQAFSKNSTQQQQFQLLAKMQLQNNSPLNRGRGRPMPQLKAPQLLRQGNLPGIVYKQTMTGGSVLLPTSYQLGGNQLFTQQAMPKTKVVNTPSISITPLPRASPSTATTSAASASQQAKPGDTNSKNSFVICEICDGYIKDLEQLRNHMQWIHKVKIHPKMIYNRPPLNCQKCQFRFFTDQGLERHLLGSHGLVTSSMQDAANRSKDSGRCPVCGRVYQWKLLNHVARDHNMTLKPAHLSYKCTVCTATFGMYKQFENHVYSAHSVVAKRVMDKKNTPTKSGSDMKPLKINDEITIIPQPAKSGNKEEKSSSGSNKNT